MEYTKLSSRPPDFRDAELGLRLQTIRIGIYLTLIVCAGVAVYALSTWQEPNRSLMLWLLPIAIGGVLPLPLLPLHRILTGRGLDVFFFCWTVADIAMIAILIAADGGLTSPLTLLLVLPLLFGSMSYPLEISAAAGLVAIGALAGVAVYSGDGGTAAGFGAFAIFCAGLMTVWGAQIQVRRRHELADSVQARARSEARSLLQAQQQEAVAQFGQSALAHPDISDLFGEALEIIRRILGVDIASVLTLDEGGEEFAVASAIGLDEIGAAAGTVAAGTGSQAGYAVMTGSPVIVCDWATEDRFECPAMIADEGVVSGLVVPIQAGGEPWGTFGAQTRTPREFSAEDISFMRSMANVLGSAVDRHRREEQTRHDALHDPLTGLANRSLFKDRLRRALARARRRQSAVAVLFVDLDDFKLVNDSLGHEAGDELLRTAAPRLIESVRVTDTVARFGGDEFTILVEDVDGEEEARMVAGRVLEALSRPFDLGGREHHLGASVGIAVGAGDSSPDGLMHDADTALYGAKQKTKGTSELFDGETRARVIERVRTEQDLRLALERDEMELHFQPVVDLRDGGISGFEALIRWRHPTRGLLHPGTFIPLAEEARLINEIGAWVIDRACRHASEWADHSHGGEPIHVGVNLSARQLVDSQLPTIVSEAIAAGGLDPRSLRLELTESLLLDDTGTAERMLDSLREIGVGLVLDDFGTGFSSLGYLKRLPLDAIKLDRSFVESLGTSSPDTAIVTATVELARALELGVVAEGVETAAQLAAIRDLGCSLAQGYYFSRPVPADKVPAMITGPAYA